jgi:hypothetical protein
MWLKGILLLIAGMLIYESIIIVGGVYEMPQPDSRNLILGAITITSAWKKCSS